MLIQMDTLDWFRKKK